MKKLCMILVSLVISISIYGQKENQRSKGESFFIKNKNSVNSYPTGRKMPKLYLKNAFQEQQRLDSLIGYLLDGTDSIIDYKEAYIYNNMDMIAEHQRFSRDTRANTWKLDDKEVYEYNPAGNLTLSIYYISDDTDMALYENWKIEYFYNDDSLSSEIIESRKDTPEAQWVLDWRTTLEYDSIQRLKTALEYSYTSQWNLAWRTEYIYDENENLVKIEEFSSDTVGGWVNENQAEYIYDTLGRLTEYIEYSWEGVPGRWENFNRETFSYLANNNLATYYDYDWNDTDDEWSLNWKEEYAYNNNYTYDQLILPWFYQHELPNFMNHMLTKFINYNYEDSVWVPASMGNFYYSSEPVTTLPGVDKNNITFYPNPVNSEVTFHLDNFSVATLFIYNLNGRIIHAQKVNHNEPVNLGPLPEGLYLFRLFDENNQTILSSKILKRNY